MPAVAWHIVDGLGGRDLPDHVRPSPADGGVKNLESQVDGNLAGPPAPGALAATGVPQTLAGDSPRPTYTSPLKLNFGSADLQRARARD
jgi:hypothetical protein